MLDKMFLISGNPANISGVLEKKNLIKLPLCWHRHFTTSAAPRLTCTFPILKPLVASVLSREACNGELNGLPC